MGAVPLQRAFDLSATFPLTLRSMEPPLRVMEADIAVARRLAERRWWEPRRAWLRRHGRRPVPPPATKTYDVPPLTLGRFLDLMSSNWSAVADGLLGSALVVVEGKSEAETLGRQLAGIDHRALTGPVCAVVPGMTPEIWEKTGDVPSVRRLILFFANVHDWSLISKAIGWGEEKTKPTTRATVTAALLSFCRAFPTQSVEDLLSTRVEGFFYLRDGASETLRGPAPELEEGDVLAHEGPIAAGHGLVKDPERRSPLWGALDAADKAVN